MPQGPVTLYDLAARSGNDAIVGIIDEVVTSAPEWTTFFAKELPGTTYKLLRRIGLPPAGFRSVNGGVLPGKSVWDQQLKEMYFLDVHIQADEAIVQAENTTVGDVMATEGVASMESTAILLGSQFYYGDNATNQGFQGIQYQLSDDSTFAGGTTNTNSVYLVDTTEDQGVHYVVGNKGRLSLPEPVRQRVEAPDGKGGKQFAYLSNLSGYVGLNVGSNNAVWRIRGIDLTHPWTDAMGAQLLLHVPLKRRKNLRWLANPLAMFTLQKSRSAVGYTTADSTGGNAFSAFPTECQGIPIVATDSLLNSETTTAS